MRQSIAGWSASGDGMARETGGGNVKADQTNRETDGINNYNDNSSSDVSDISDIALSELGSDEINSDADIIPYQRLTINNTTALQAALQRIQLDYDNLPFAAHQRVTSDPRTLTQITTPMTGQDEPESDDALANDDLRRELYFYAQAHDSVVSALRRLREFRCTAVTASSTLSPDTTISHVKRTGQLVIPITRPPDYFAEMVKDATQIDRIRQHALRIAEAKKASQEARARRAARAHKRHARVIQKSHFKRQHKADRKGKQRRKAA